MFYLRKSTYIFFMVPRKDSGFLVAYRWQLPFIMHQQGYGRSEGLTAQTYNTHSGIENHSIFTRTVVTGESETTGPAIQQQKSPWVPAAWSGFENRGNFSLSLSLKTKTMPTTPDLSKGLLHLRPTPCIEFSTPATPTSLEAHHTWCFQPSVRLFVFAVPL